MQEDGTRFKVSYPFSPYFYVLTRRELLLEVSQFLNKKFSQVINKIEIVAKDDLDMVTNLNTIFKQLLVFINFLAESFNWFKAEIFEVVFFQSK